MADSLSHSRFAGHCRLHRTSAPRIPSRLLYFPNENHWVLKPANSIEWHTQVLKWLDEWTKAPGK